MQKEINLKKAIRYANHHDFPSIHIFNGKNKNKSSGVIHNSSTEVCEENKHIIKDYDLDENKISNSENQLLELIKQLLEKGCSIFVMIDEKWALKFTESEEYATKSLDQEGYYGFFVNTDLSYEPGYYDIEIGMFAEEKFKHLHEVSEHDPIYDKLIKTIDELDIFN